MSEKIAVCPGSFDPITMGHIDIIKRASAVFDKVIVAVMTNTAKVPTFAAEHRLDMINRSLEGVCDNVETEIFGGLLADYVRQKHACAIVKGLRAVSDFEYEFQLALINKKINPGAETLFFTTSAENMYLSSSVVRSVASVGGDISPFVPECIIEDIKGRFSEKTSLNDNG